MEERFGFGDVLDDVCMCTTPVPRTTLYSVLVKKLFFKIGLLK